MDDLVAANCILADSGVLDAFGHVSVRHDRNPERFVISSSLAAALVTSADLIEYDLDGRGINVRGRGEYSERFIHAEIYSRACALADSLRSQFDAASPDVPYGGVHWRRHTHI